MNSNQSPDPEESFALDAYRVLPGTQPPASLDMRILAAAHAANARGSAPARRWGAGIATAAVAVLAVGIAWRGMDTRAPDLPASSERRAPTMQPAFKIEAAPPVREQRGTDARGESLENQQPPDAPAPAASPALSAADWQTADAAQDPARAAREKDSTAEFPSRVVQQSHRESELAESSEPVPAARRERGADSTAAGSARPETAAQPMRTPKPIAAAEVPTERQEQIAAPTFAPPPLPQRVEGSESGAAGEESQRSDSVESSSSTIAASSESLTKPRAPDIGAGEMSRTLALVSAEGIHAGTTSLPDAVSALRAADARGDHAVVRRLAQAIEARFGRASLPRDLQPLVGD